MDPLSIDSRPATSMEMFPASPAAPTMVVEIWPPLTTSNAAALTLTLPEFPEFNTEVAEISAIPFAPPSIVS
jgi:hypothetical protein